MATRLRRSCLVLPASSQKMLAKAAALPADEVIVDLEDGVAVADKESARANLAPHARRGRWPSGSTASTRRGGARTSLPQPTPT